MSMCAVSQCPNEARKRGWCDKHYQRWRNNGDPEKLVKVRGVCSVEECSEPHVALSFCTRHVTRFRKHGSADAVQHYLLNVRGSERLGDCEVCGPDTPLVVNKSAVNGFSCALKARAYSSKQNHRRYGLSDEEYRELVDSQSGKCSACGQVSDLVIDHCHDTGRVRGLLCCSCNWAEGHLKSSPRVAVNLAAYLLRPAPGDNSFDWFGVGG